MILQDRARPLLIVGAGDRARQALATIRAGGDWVPVGALDDDPAWHGRDLDGVPVLGSVDLVHQLPDAALLACDPAVVAKLGLPPDRWVCLS